MSCRGYEACDESIRRLIRRAASQVFASGDLDLPDEAIKASLPATQNSLPEYFKLASYGEREDYHARLKTYVSSRAIYVDWDRSAGAGVQISRLSMMNATMASHQLGVRLPWVVAREAVVELRAIYKKEMPDIEPIINAWTHGKAFAGISAENAKQIIDSLLVIHSAKKRQSDKKDVLLRRLSVELFHDSKRIEALVRPLAALLGEREFDGDNNVFAELGLVKHPQPMLISGSSSHVIETTYGLCPLLPPFIGISPDSLVAIQQPKSNIRLVLTIENLASFNEAAHDANQPEDLLVVYVAGQPTPTLLSAYQRLLVSIKPESVWHWGDIDVGGFRIANRLAQAANAVHYSVSLWNMCARDTLADRSESFTNFQLRQICDICDRNGWAKESDAVKENPYSLEQEFIHWEVPAPCSKSQRL